MSLVEDVDEKIRKLAQEYPTIFEEAYKAVKTGKVKKYIFQPSGRVVWIVVGRHMDYLILPKANYCTCDDFFFRVLDQEKPVCYHILAVKIATLTQKYETIEETDDWYKKLIKEWLPKKTTPK